MTTWRVRFINYPLHFSNLKTEIMETIGDVLARGDLILRQQTEAFEANLAESLSLLSLTALPAAFCRLSEGDGASSALSLKPE